MRLYILGTNTDDKGKQLETLTAEMLKKQGYINISANVISSGGSEVDAIATQRTILGTEAIDTQIICECKAHNKPITINDWMKFIGKVYVEKLKNDLTVGIMIALSGANGNVVGSYIDIKSRNCPFIKLMAGDDLISFLIKEYSLAPAPKVEAYIRRFTDRSISTINLIYYEKSIYWVIGFIEGGFALLTKDVNPLNDIQLDVILKLLDENTEYTGYIDIEKENAAYERRVTIDKLVVSILMDSDSPLSSDDISQIREGLDNKDSDFEISKEEIRYALEHNAFVNELNGKYRLKRMDTDSMIDFYRYLLTGVLPVRVFSREMYSKKIDKALLTKVLEMQYKIKIPAEKEEECLFFLRYSPSALAYALYPDKDLIRYRSPDGSTIADNIDKGHTQWFMQNLTNLFIKDFHNQALHDSYFRDLKIDTLQIDQTIVIKKDKEIAISSTNNKSMLLAQLTEEYNNQVILISELPKDEKS